MRQAQEFVLWGTGILVLIHLVAIGLSWYHFGYLDGETVWDMALVLVAPVAVGLGGYFLLADKVSPASRRSGGACRVPRETPVH